MMGISGSRDLTTGVIWKQLLIFSVPIFLSSVLQQFYNMIDVWFLGNFVGTDAVAAAGGVAGSFINICIALFNGFSASVTIIIGQLFGYGKKTALRNVICNAVFFGAVTGIILGGVCIGFTPFVLRTCGVQEEIMDMAVSYLRIYFIGTVPMFLYNMASGMLRAMGDSRTPLYVLILGCVVNIVGDIGAIQGMGLGIEGAALATIFAQTVSAAASLYVLFSRTKENGKTSYGFHLDMPAVKRIFSLGVPCGIQNMAYSFANLILQSAINQFGTDTVAAMSVFCRADSICWAAAEAYGLALTTFAAQNYGAGKFRRMAEGTKVAVIGALITEAVFSVIYLSGARWYFGFFTDNEDVIHIGIRIVWTIVPFYVTYCFIDTLAGTIKGIGRTLEPMIITFSGVCVLRIVWVIAVQKTGGNFTQILHNYPVTWMTTSMLFIVYTIFIWKKFQKTMGRGEEKSGKKGNYFSE